MNLLLYKMTCDHNVVNKESNIGECVYRTLLLKHNPNNVKQFEILTSEDISEYNYAYIPKFKNYYYISEPTIVNGEIKGYTFTKDVLMSNKEFISNLSCMVSRSESHSNAFITDSKYVVSSKNKIITRKFPVSINDDSICLITVG